jgi:hypothetical protein
MRARRAWVALLLGVVLLAAQQPRRQNRWAQYEHEMQDPIDDPPDAGERTEFAFARLRFRSPRDGYFRRHLRWGTDANKSERLFMQALRRLSRVHVRSIEEVVDIDSDALFDWPFLYAVGVGDWALTDEHAARLRRYLDRGGTLMVDDFHNEREWGGFMQGMHKVYPGRAAVEIEGDDPIFQIAYDTRNPGHVPGYQIVWGQEWERGGVGGRYRAILDPNGRIQVIICFNMDLGDAWEWADAPEYPEKYASLALRIGVNSVLYAMTH